MRAFIALALTAVTTAAGLWHWHGPASADPPGQVTVRYMMWDAGQVPAYRQCADQFMARHPHIRIRISQAGWGDYWTALAAGFIAGSAPDVFVNHATQFPQFVGTGVLEDLSGYLSDAMAPGDFEPGLWQAWTRRGRPYALPKDWDTVALIVNLDHARAQGVGLQELQTMDWNPQDGGSFGRIVRRLSRDAQGRSGDHSQFNARHVQVYGFQLPGTGGMVGQTQWAPFAGSLGYQPQPEPWAVPLNYADPRLVSTIEWLSQLSSQGLSAPLAQVQSLGTPALFATGRVAMVPDGSWMIRHYARTVPFRYAWVPMPQGPQGQRATLLNGLGDSMWAGSRVKPQAWAWMQHLASAECQALVATTKVVFPARRGLAQQVVDAHARDGIDAQAFLTMAEGLTIPMPMADQSSRIESMVKGALESVFLGREGAGEALGRADRKVRALGSAAGP